MKYILTQTNGTILGPFTKIIQTIDSHICDETTYFNVTTGDVVQSEVPDDYVNPIVIEDYNTQQSQLRAKAYPVESDPIFFEWQRGTKTQQEWLDAVDQVKLQYPYKSI